MNNLSRVEDTIFESRMHVDDVGQMGELEEGTEKIMFDQSRCEKQTKLPGNRPELDEKMSDR